MWDLFSCSILFCQRFIKACIDTVILPISKSILILHVLKLLSLILLLFITYFYLFIYFWNVQLKCFLFGQIRSLYVIRTVTRRIGRQYLNKLISSIGCFGAFLLFLFLKDEINRTDLSLCQWWCYWKNALGKLLPPLLIFFLPSQYYRMSTIDWRESQMLIIMIWLNNKSNLWVLVK